MAAAVFGCMSLALTNSIATLAPVSLLKPSSICFLKNGSASGMKLDHCRTERLTPLRFGVDGLVAGPVCPAAAGLGDAPGDGEAPGAGEPAGAAGLVGSAGFGASVGLAGAVAPPPQALSSNRLDVPAVSARNPRRESGRIRGVLSPESTVGCT